VIREIEGQPDYLFRFINSRRPFDPHFNREAVVGKVQYYDVRGNLFVEDWHG